jgi:L,D-peptidoglycan transpeptidase YkuD (ErfK/YbiS/YcfS/YnhG family)
MKTNSKLIIIKNKRTLKYEDFFFKCAIGKKGITSKKIERDKKTPKGTYELGNLFYRTDRVKKPLTSLKCLPILPNMIWCDDLKNKKNYNKLINSDHSCKSEKLYRNDHKYDYLIPIMYNTTKTILGKGSAIFIHLTKNYKGTAGCITLNEKDFLILIKVIKKNTKIKIQ